jgi:hypothetical protein
MIVYLSGINQQYNNFNSYYDEKNYKNNYIKNYNNNSDDINKPNINYDIYYSANKNNNYKNINNYNNTDNINKLNFDDDIYFSANKNIRENRKIEESYNNKIDTKLEEGKEIKKDVNKGKLFK